MLLKGNLTPTEKFILLIQDEVNRIKTGKEILTPADRDALENWKAQTNKEAHEWNRLNDGFKQTAKMNVEVEFTYKDAQVAYLAQLPITSQLLFYPYYREMRGCIKTLKNIKKATPKEVMEAAEKQKQVKLKEGMDFDYAIYQLAFELLSEKDKKQMKDLYEEIEYEHQYLDQEEIIANLFNGKETLTQKAKEKLATLVAERSYNVFAKEYQFFHYFACIPIAEVARYFLKSKGVEVKGKNLSKNQESDDEDSVTHDKIDDVVKKYAQENKISVETLLKEGCLQWLDDGLLDEYTPLVISTSAELFERWLKTKVKAKSILLKHIENKELTLRKRSENETFKHKLRSKDLYDIELNVARKVLENLDLELRVEKAEGDERVAFEEFNESIITGESLYTFKGEYGFVKKFKERADEYDANLGIVYADDDPEHTGEHLDQEFIVCSQNGKGDASFFSLYGMSISMLSSFFDGKLLFKEKVKDKKTYIEFKDPMIEAIFKERRKLMIDGYAKLLAFEKLFKKLGRIYQSDLEWNVRERIKRMKEHIDQFNETIRVATNTSEEERKYKEGIFRRKEVLYFEEEQIIDTEKILPDETVIEEYRKKFEDLFEEF